MELRYIGTIVKAHGVRGECLLADVHYVPPSVGDRAVYLGYTSAQTSRYNMQSIRTHKAGAIIKLNSVDTVTDAENLREFGVFCETQPHTTRESEEMPVDESIDSLIDFNLIDARSGLTLGRVVDHWSIPLYKVLVVRTLSGGEADLPYIPQFIHSVDHQTRVIRVTPPEGLLDEVRE